MNDKILVCAFSLLDEGRKYSGNHRKYVIENARDICYSPETRELIKLREAVGYYGHGRRVLCGKMKLQEVDVITLPDGTQAMVSNVPSNVTLAFDVGEDGTVTHTQEILDTETGKIVAGLNASRVGGFSWACPGKDGGSRNVTTLTGFSGFDYVLTPGFAKNRAYVLEAAREQQVLESVAAVVGDDDRAQKLVAGWRFGAAEQILDLHDRIFEADERFFDLKEKHEKLQTELATALGEKAKAATEVETLRSDFRRVLEGLSESLPFFIPEGVMHDMLDGDFSRARMLFEGATTFDFGQYPLKQHSTRQAQDPAQVEPAHEEPEYGSASYGFALDV